MEVLHADLECRKEVWDARREVLKLERRQTPVPVQIRLQHHLRRFSEGSYEFCFARLRHNVVHLLACQLLCVRNTCFAGV